MRNILMTGVAALAATMVVAACTAADNEGGDAKAALEEANKEKALYCMDLLFNQKNIEKLENLVPNVEQAVIYMKRGH